MSDLVSELPAATIVAAGFIANAPSPRSGPAKNLALSSAQRTSLGHNRLLSSTQYMIVRRDA